MVKAFFWGTTALLTWIWGFFRLPETRGRTFEGKHHSCAIEVLCRLNLVLMCSLEMDIMFQRKIPSRKFASYDFNGEILEARGHE